MDKQSGLNFPQNYWKGLFLILMAYSTIQLLLSRPDLEIPGFPGLFRQLFRWFTISLVYFTGGYVLQRTKITWLTGIWHLIHLALIAYLGLVTCYEYLIAPVAYGIRSSVAPIVEFLISPVLYLGAGLVYAIYMQDK